MDQGEPKAETLRNLSIKGQGKQAKLIIKHLEKQRKTESCDQFKIMKNIIFQQFFPVCKVKIFAFKRK